MLGCFHAFWNSIGDNGEFCRTLVEFECFWMLLVDMNIKILFAAGIEHHNIYFDMGHSWRYVCRIICFSVLHL